VRGVLRKVVDAPDCWADPIDIRNVPIPCSDRPAGVVSFRDIDSYIETSFSL
jgi:hypothetical protein